jgi:hypothetical protein
MKPKEDPATGVQTVPARKHCVYRPKIDGEQLHRSADETICDPSQPNREAKLLRFFDQRSFAAIGVALKLNEDSACKRIDRALEKLRAVLFSHGITLSIAALSIVVAARAATVAGQDFTRANSQFAPLADPEIGEPVKPASAKAPLAINPAWRAIIVVGLAADEEQAARFVKQADELNRAFQLRGVGPTAIQIVRAGPGGTVTRDTVLAAFHPFTPPSEETWIVLLGHAAVNRAGQPAFQVTGPRLAATDFATAVGALPGNKFVVVGTTMSGGFLASLAAKPEIEAVAATNDTGEINEPRFAQNWADALAAKPEANFAALASDATARVQAFYHEHGLAQGEHARLIDRDTKTIIDVPVPAKPSASAPAL